MRSLMIKNPVNMRVDSGENGGNVLSGYAAVFYDERNEGTEYRMFDGVRERIMPGAFDDMRGDYISTFNHDPNQLLGRTEAGTLRFSVDEIGLRYEVDLPDTQIGNDVGQLAKRGDIDGSSFWFDFYDSDYSKRSDDDGEIWELNSVRGMIEFGPVTVPAYKATSAYKRSVEFTEKVLSEDRNKANTTRLRYLAKSRGLEV